MGNAISRNNKQIQHFKCWFDFCFCHFRRILFVVFLLYTEKMICLVLLFLSFFISFMWFILAFGINKFSHTNTGKHTSTPTNTLTQTRTLTGQHDTRFSIGGTAAETISNESKRARRLVATDRNCPNQKMKNVAAASCGCLSTSSFRTCCERVLLAQMLPSRAGCDTCCRMKWVICVLIYLFHFWIIIFN